MIMKKKNNKNRQKLKILVEKCEKKMWKPFTPYVFEIIF